MNFPWSVPTRFKVGDEIYSHVDRGRVIEVDAVAGIMRVTWDDGDGGTITYPLDADYFETELPEKMPWEPK